jgi:hypothetical protein
MARFGGRRYRRIPAPAATQRIKRKIPPCGGTFLLSLTFTLELAIPLRVGLALTARILLLLARLLAATLLLTGLLTRGLVLLARTLIGVRH